MEYSRGDLNETADVSNPLMLLPELEPLLCNILHSINRDVLLYRRKLSVRIASCHLRIQGVTGGTDQTSGECSLGQTIPM